MLAAVVATINSTLRWCQNFKGAVALKALNGFVVYGGIDSAISTLTVLSTKLSCRLYRATIRDVRLASRFSHLVNCLRMSSLRFSLLNRELEAIHRDIKQQSDTLRILNVLIEI